MVIVHTAPIWPVATQAVVNVSPARLEFPDATAWNSNDGKLLVSSGAVGARVTIAEFACGTWVYVELKENQ